MIDTMEAQGPIAPTAIQAVTDLMRNARASERLLTEWLKPYDIDVPAVVVLELVSTGVVLPSAIAEYLRQASPTVSHVISRLHDQGYVVRGRSEEDGRQRPLALTDAGASLLGSVHKAIDEALEAGRYRLEDTDARRLDKALAKWSKALRLDQG
jgi:DNA-binding MarR family transcriptional regulator